MPHPTKRVHEEEEHRKQDKEGHNQNKDAQAPDESSNEVGDIGEFTTKAFKNVVGATKAVNAFPQGTARALYMTYPGYARVIDDLSQRVVGLIGNVLQVEGIKGDIRKRQLDEQFEMVQECNDILFERVTTNLDLKAGLRRNPQQMVEVQMNVVSSSSSSSVAADSSPSLAQDSPKAGSWNRSSAPPQKNVVSARLFTAKNIVRPQMLFKEPVDNSALNPFVPRLKEKPNSLKPLALLPEYDDSGNIQAYLHPYEFELMKFEPPVQQLQKQKPILPNLMSDTELMLVDSVEKLKQALEELRQAPQIAIDVEHHSYRTFMGITCLVQMSTRSKDYIFDTLILRDEMHILNLVLTDPKKLKILHGADLDIEWLQRDLSLYIVNMFDTHRAAKALNLARLSLAFLLKHYIDLDVDKSLQLADWRMRPLPQQLVDYARQDTHFLIYVYERMTNDLLEQQVETGLLNNVYMMSTEVCKKRYNKPHVGPESHLDLVRKTKRNFDNRQLYALRGIFEWRDATARLEDESYGYVLPNHMMLQIAESLPREMQGILACCNPIPPLVRQQLHTLHQIVLKARDQPLVKPILEARSSTQASLPPSSKDFSSKLYCPHDFSHQDEIRDDLPTLLKRNTSGRLQLPDEKQLPTQDKLIAKPSMALFEKSDGPTQEEELRWAHMRKESQALRMPYKRYLAILPLMEQLKQDQIAREHSEQLKRRLCPTASAPEENIKLQAPATKAEVEIYSLPLKEQLKRKHQSNMDGEQPSTSKKARKDENTQPIVKKEINEQNESIEVVEPTEESDEDDVLEVPIERQPADQAKPPQNQGKRQKRKQLQQRFKAKNRANHPQGSNLQVPQPKPAGNFDYKNVDFRQFKGGAQRARGTEIKQQMHGKNRPNNRHNKQFNKLFTFSNVKKEGKK
ncbi:uncharacterized protein Dana_GF18126 [Drosophila ananassae]|uniref:Exosome complex component 10 homolog n=1 Tax=Drosophila ananassae TaxID=7217 RepID=B3LWR0_DROAN|nr:exosome component 10 [Drosophila ananassae]EDV42698.1 uncharacterized protein Dana_GF18126 [Drosophila ananassae]